MSVSNFAVDAVARSGGLYPQNMFATSVADNVETGNPENLIIATVTSAVNYDISGAQCVTLFPSSGIYSLICDSAGTADLSAVGRVALVNGVYTFTGFQATTSLNGAGFVTYAQMLNASAGVITLQQNSGSPANYIIYATKLAN
jgi:hypothetical protein